MENFTKFNNPIGNYEMVEGCDGKIRLKGWTYDPDVPSQSLDIHVYVGGSCADKNASAYVMNANVERADVNSAYGVSGNHGFYGDITTSKRGEQEVYVYAINVGSGDNVLLDHKTVRITEPYQNKRTIPDGDYQIVSALDNNKCIDLCAGSAENGTRVEIHSLNGGKNQIWHVEYVTNGYYKVTNKMSDTALDVPGMASANETKLQGHAKNDSYAQQWIIKEADDGEYFYLTSKCNGLNIDVLNADTSDACPLVVNYINTSDAERWKFIACTDEGKTISDGDYHILSYGEPSYGLDLFDNRAENGNNIGIWENTKDDNQIFTVKYLGNGYYTLKNKSTGMALDVGGFKDHNDQEVTVYEYNESDAQQWIIGQQRFNGSYTIRTKCGGFYMEADLPPTDDLPDLDTYAKTTLQSDESHSKYGVSSFMQSWVFIPVEEQALVAELNDCEISFSWNRLSWAEKYDVIIMDENGRDYSQSGLEDTKLDYSLPEGKYVAYIKSKNQFYSFNCEEISFSIKKNTESAIEENISLSEAIYTYNGKPQSIEISGELPQGVSVAYINNAKKDAGTYMVQAKFVDDASGKILDIKSAKMTILPMEVSELVVAPITPQSYTGAEIQPALTVSASVLGVYSVLSEKIDYTVQYSNNIDIGTAIAEVSLCGNYKGSQTVTYQIVKGDNKWTIPLGIKDTIYGMTPEPKAEAIYDLPVKSTSTTHQLWHEAPICGIL